MRAQKESSSDLAGNTVVLSPLRVFLAEHDDFDIAAERVSDKTLTTWLTEADNAVRSGARAAYLIGRVLVVRRPKHGKVAEWAAEEAKRLGRQSRTLRLYMQVARRHLHPGAQGRRWSGSSAGDPPSGTLTLLGVRWSYPERDWQGRGRRGLVCQYEGTAREPADRDVRCTTA